MEEIPNLNLNQLPEEPGVEVDSKRDLFADSWKKFRSRFTDFSLENIRHSDNVELSSAKQERDKDDDDEDITDDEDEDDKQDNKKNDVRKATKKNNKFFLSKNYKDEPDTAIAQEESNLINEERIYELPPEAVNTADDEQEPDAPVFEQLNTQAQANLEEIDYTEVTSTPVSEDIFSIKEVINKKRAQNPVLGEQHTAVQNINNYYVKEEVVYRQRTGGLIALDILNYGLALRRDNKNKRLSDKKIQKLSDEVKKKLGIVSKVNKQADLPKSILKIDHSSNQIQEHKFREVEPISNNDVVKEVKIVERVVYEDLKRPTVLPETFAGAQNVVEKTIYNSNPEISIEVPRNFETVGRNNELFEKRFNREIQRSNKQKPKSPMMIVEQPPAIDYQKVVSTEPPRVDNKSLSENKDYKNVIMPGVWGAITGIIVFIILYMVTIR